jgi:hypothetical protein
VTCFGGGGGAAAARAEQRDRLAAFVSRRREEGGIRRGQSLLEGQRGGEGRAVGQRQRAAGAVVVAGVDSPGARGDSFVENDDLQPAEREPAQLLLDVGRGPALVAD